MALDFYEFGSFRYDPTQRLLFRGSELVPLVPKVADTLHVLVINEGRIVEKAELIRQVWPDATVEDTGLARNISLLRSALGDESYIETIPRRGYRLVGLKTPAPASQAEPTPPPPPPQSKPKWPYLLLGLLALALLVFWQFYRPSPYLPDGAGRASLAVVPFEWIPAGNAADAQAFHELLSASLAKTPGIQLISPSTVARYRTLHIPTALMSRILNLDVILEGTVQISSGEHRITPRLTDVHSGKVIWADVQAVPSAEWATTQTPAAAALAERIGAQLASAKGS